MYVTSIVSLNISLNILFSSHVCRRGVNEEEGLINERENPDGERGVRRKEKRRERSMHRWRRKSIGAYIWKIDKQSVNISHAAS